jgi:hypothetical protein
MTLLRERREKSSRGTKKEKSLLNLERKERRTKYSNLFKGREI